jgi:beta-glucanase (GH16 family)
MIRALLTTGAVVVAAWVAVPGASGQPTDTAAGANAAAPAAIGGLTWSDDFDGPAGAAPDGSKWAHDTGGSGWGNNELEYYTNSTSNAALDGQGHLLITARQENPAGYQCWYGSCTYTSARLLTSGHFTQQYGRFEARIKLPRGQGMWPAFWMLGDNIGSVGWPGSGEMDVMENIGREPSTNHGSMHGPGYSGGNPLTGTYSINGAFADDFHTFAVDWGPNIAQFSVDGNVYETHTPADTNGNPWVFDHPFFMLLNVAVGGNWPGSPDGSTQFPQTMAVDYVHVYSWASGGGGSTGQITGLAGKCLDVNGANPANGTAVQLYTCNGSSAQQWTRPGDGTIRALGKCLDVPGGSTANGAQMQIYDCNGSGAQQWRVESAGDIVNVPANKCLDVTGGNSADGTRTQIWDCSGAANQKWVV